MHNIRIPRTSVSIRRWLTFRGQGLPGLPVNGPTVLIPEPHEQPCVEGSVDSLHKLSIVNRVEVSKVPSLVIEESGVMREREWH